MRTLRIALLQLKPEDSQEGNRLKGVEACRAAKQMGADIVLFPEMWNIGYRIFDRSREEIFAEALPLDHSFVQTFADLAGELKVAIGITLLEKSGNHMRNTLVLFDRFGERKLTYSKVNTCDFGPERWLEPGEDFFVTTLSTACGNVQVGAMICFDREQPESARILMLKGAELILVPNACGLNNLRMAQLRTRAFENAVCIATCNYPSSTDKHCNGHSNVFDGVDGSCDNNSDWDSCLLEAGTDETICLASLDLDCLRKYRQTTIFGNAYRKPHAYTLLTSPEVNFPFRRSK